MVSDKQKVQVWDNIPSQSRQKRGSQLSLISVLTWSCTSKSDRQTSLVRESHVFFFSDSLLAPLVLFNCIFYVAKTRKKMTETELFDRKDPNRRMSPCLHCYYLLFHLRYQVCLF